MNVRLGNVITFSYFFKIQSTSPPPTTPKTTTKRPAKIEYEPLVKNSLRKTSPLFANQGYAHTKPRLENNNKLSTSQGQDLSYSPTQDAVPEQEKTFDGYFKTPNRDFDAQFEPRKKAEVSYR